MNDASSQNKTQAELLAEGLEAVKFSNVLGLLVILKEIQEQKPLSDPDALGIDNGELYF